MIIIPAVILYLVTGLGVSCLLAYTEPTEEGKDAGSEYVTSALLWPLQLPFALLVIVSDRARAAGLRAKEKAKATKRENAAREAEIDKIIKEHAL